MERGSTYRFFAELYSCIDDSYTHKFINGNWPAIETAPEPSLISWANLGYGWTNRKIRKLIVYLILVIILALGTSGITYFTNMSNQQSEDLVVYEDFCDAFYTQDEAFASYELGDPDQLNCYCFEQYNEGEDLGAITFSDGGKYCETWYDDFLRRQGAIYGLTLVILIISSTIEILIPYIIPIEAN